MSITTTIDSVTPQDPVRTAISSITGRNQATIKFTPTNSTGQTITCWRVELGGAGIVGAGHFMDKAGFPCSDSLAEAKCSDSDPLALCTDGINSPSGTQITETINYAETGGPADETATVYVYVGAVDTALS